jgi:hypothetical protein
MWAEGVVAGRADLHRAVDVLEAMAPFELDPNQAQRIVADALTLPREPERQQERQPQPRAPPRVADSTLAAAEYLVKLGDAERLRHWLMLHSLDERAAIRRHIAEKPDKQNEDRAGH